jgi:hypothetical protein
MSYGADPRPQEATSAANTPASEPLSRERMVELAINELIEKQRATEFGLKAAQDALSSAEDSKREMEANFAREREAMIVAMREVMSGVGIGLVNKDTGLDHTAPRDWRPPTWDGQTPTFRDYIGRIRSAYRTRSGLKPALTNEQYWDAINDSIPYLKRARMRSFWECGGPGGRKEPAEFLAALERTFADATETAKALAKLTVLRHQPGQPWHEHQLIFDELLYSANGTQWDDQAKIVHLERTFSESVIDYTVAMKECATYDEFVNEVARIMARYERTDEHKRRHKAWLQQGGEPGNIFADARSPTGRAPQVDTDGDTVMTSTRTAQRSGSRNNYGGSRSSTAGASTNGKANMPRAKWVSPAEYAKRRERDLCLRCGGSGHRRSSCEYRPASNPTRATTTTISAIVHPVLEDSDQEETEAAAGGSGKA